MLHKIDLRLREITQKTWPFGNIAIFAFGDIMQMKPVKGRYIMQDPRNEQFELGCRMDPLWRKFECINLEINHRQGEDKAYADMLNRIRIGADTPEDIEKLRERVRDINHPDIRKEHDAIYIFGTNKKVNQMNNKRIQSLKGEEKVVMAICIHKTIRKFSPSVNNAGTVGNTSFQNELKITIGAKIMMTYNVDTSDGLTNGARGELIGIIQDESGHISKLIVKFEELSNGKEKRRHNPGIVKRFPGGTPIEKVNFPFSISKSKKSVINTANVIQFPLKLAFACTAHKIQGATIPKPLKAILDVTDIFQAAMVYVMLSRVCALSQIFILNKFDESKMYPSIVALKELQRLDEISHNRNLSEWENTESGLLRISSLNCRSLKKHYQDIITDDLILKSDIIFLQETWLEDGTSNDELQIPDYNLHLNSSGKGKGVAIYFKEDTFKHELDISKDSMQLSKFTSSLMDIIVLYRSQSGTLIELQQNIEKMRNKQKTELIIGDFNFCYLKELSNPTRKYLKENKFLQLVQEPTHIEGSLIDQAHLRDVDGTYDYSIDLHSKYYTDHKALALLVKKGRNK